MKALVGGIIAAMIATAASAQTQLVSEDFMVKSPDAGIEIFVRNKRPANMASFRPERTVVYVHGATYPASTAFDLKLDGVSWMEYIASRGYDVYLLDLRGYGKSTRPKEMAEDASKNPPIVRNDNAIKDISTVVDFVLARRSIPRVNLIGWSWGTALMAGYTAQNNAKVERLVLYAPAWIRTTPSLVQAGPGPMPAYRTVSRDSAMGRHE
jgi:pimeloyl-ACP methyl ester carboxylesterase